VQRVTVHYAKTHLSRLLRDVARGETVIIARGEQPVAQLVPVAQEPAASRPKIGAATSEGVSWSDDAFQPLSDAELAHWGL